MRERAKPAGALTSFFLRLPASVAALHRDTVLLVFILQLPELAPALVLILLGRIRILLSLQPELEPVDVALVDAVPMLGLDLLVVLVRVDPHLDRLVAVPQRRVERKSVDVFAIGSVHE